MQWEDLWQLWSIVLMGSLNLLVKEVTAENINIKVLINLLRDK